MNPQDVHVIIPSYNDTQVIVDTITPLIELGYYVVVVDDGSKENIAQVCVNLPITVLRHKINLGQGAALQTGMAYAIKNGAKYIVHFDADGQHPHNEIKSMINLLIKENVDIVMGSRFLRKEDEREIPTIRKFVLKLARLVNFVFTGLSLSDAHNGFRVMTARAADKIEITENRMAHATEIPALVKKYNLKYCEHPTKIIYTDYSKSKGQGSLNSINILIDLIFNKLFR